MNVIVWGINYAPEPTGIAPYNAVLCEYLRGRGHDVRMLTSFCYYPAWQKLPQDKGKIFRTDLIAGVPVHRCWHYVPRWATTLKRIVHEGSFVTLSALRLLFLPRAEILVVVSPPLLLGAAAWVIGWLKRMPFVFHVQDLQPDAATGLGLLKPGWLAQTLFWLEKFAYAKAARVSGIIPAMVQAFRDKGLAGEKIFAFPNGVRLPEPSRIPARGGFRQRHGLKPEDFVFLYSGNLGVKQGLELLVEAARLVKHPRVQLVLCGEGSQRDALAALIERSRLPNIRLLPLQPEHDYHQMLVDADVCVIPQQRGSGRCFFPSKLLTTLAFAKPVLSVADAESALAEAVGRWGFGVNVAPGNAARLAEEIIRLAGGAEALPALGRAGRAYVEQFEFTVVLRRFEQVLMQLRSFPAVPAAMAPKVQPAPD